MRAMIRLAPLAIAALVLAPPLTAQEPAADGGLAGALLAGRAAVGSNDFAAQVEYYSRANMLAPEDPFFLDRLLVAHLALGDVDAAVPVARDLLAAGVQSEIASLTLQADAFVQGDYAAVVAAEPPLADTGALTDALAPAWAAIGAGSMSDAISRFEAAAEAPQLRVLAQYHRALALAMVGDFESAHDILSGGDGQPIGMGRRGMLARIQVLAQLDRLDEARALADSAFSQDAEPDIRALRAALADGAAPPFDLVTSPAQGMAEVYFVLASLLGSDDGEQLPLIYARLAAHLNPDHHDAILMAGRLLEALEQFELADATYAQIPPDAAFFLGAQLGRGQALFEKGDVDGAIEALRALAEEVPDEVLVHSTLGDLLRRDERFAEAARAYGRAIDLLPEAEARHWVLFFTRGIALERDDRFDEAEAYFRRALDLNPDQPSVLNYLGYSLVEERRDLDEALDMIERAVEGDPDSGYITDSLGWALYRLGRYDEALPVMERAVELLPSDPIINDHLGDVYWMVGREREARFQWRRALSFAPHPDLEVDRIRHKLEVGLDVVLEEEEAEAQAAAE